MILSELKYYKFAGQLTKPIQTSKRLISVKRGFILRISNKDGLFGYGEISPLEGLSNETIDEVEDSLIDLVTRINNRDSIFKIISHNRFSKVPSLLFGIEQAANNLISAKSASRYNQLIRIPVNYLVSSPDIDDTIKSIQIAYSRGWRTLKIKMGINPFEEELKLLAKINDVLPDLKLRLDMNGSWNIDEAKEKIPGLSVFNIEYIEQPVEGMDELIELSGRVGVQLAADESIRTVNDALRALEQASINYIVIKPMNLGFENSIRIINSANTSGKYAIISTMFESYVGLSGLLQLASLANHSYAHGIDSYLSIDSLALSFNYTPMNGCITFDNNLDFKKTNILFEDQL